MPIQFRTLIFTLAPLLSFIYISAARAAIEAPVLQLSSGARLHMLASKYETFWQNSKNLPIKQQVAEWRRVIEPTFYDYYEARLADWSEVGISPTLQLKINLRLYSDIRTEFNKKLGSMPTHLNESLVNFAHYFSDMNTNIDVYAIHSLSSVDGGLRHVGSKTYFILGVDSMAQYHHFDNEQPFYTHELFHVYHNQFFHPDQNEEQLIWPHLWREGLATYVAEKLNPDGTPAQLMLDTPVGLIANCEKNMPRLWHYLNENLDSDDTPAYRALFLISGQNTQIPTRAGYYLGYTIAKELGQRYTLEQLAHLSPEQAHTLIEQVVERHLRP